MNWTHQEPTSEQCSANAAVPASSPKARAFACWYPQMGGYVGRAVVEILVGADDPCFEAWVWHDGEFPFSGGDRGPAHLHHCDAGQFIAFGQMVQAKQDEG